MEKKALKKIALAGVFIALIAAFFIFDLRQYLTLSYIKEYQERFQSLYLEHRAAVIAAYMAGYILVTALSLPGAAVMTLAGGAMFGLLVGTIVVSFASTIGATLACAVSRFLLRDWVQAKVGARLRAINEGIEREGAFYLFTMRLIPAIPFWLINLAMGLTRMRLWTFYWVSQIGMLAGTVVYVNAGKELARIEAISGILSLRLVGSFVLLGVFPIAAKKLIALYRRKKDKKSIDEVAKGGKDG